MPRQPRLNFPGLFYHVIVRGIERRAIFRDTWDYLKRKNGNNVRVSRSCVEDEGRPLGIGLHRRMSNRIERLYSKG